MNTVPPSIGRARFASPKVFRAFYAGGHYSLRGGGLYSLYKCPGGTLFPKRIYSVRGDSIHSYTVYNVYIILAVYNVHDRGAEHFNACNILSLIFYCQLGLVQQLLQEGTLSCYKSSVEILRVSCSYIIIIIIIIILLYSTD